MQLHTPPTPNYPFCFSTTIIHFFMMLKVYTLIAKLLCMKRDKKNTASQVDKTNLS